MTRINNSGDGLRGPRLQANRYYDEAEQDKPPIAWAAV
jgi:hypothetical protein